MTIERQEDINIKNDSYDFGLSIGYMRSLLTVTEDTGRKLGM